MPNQGKAWEREYQNSKLVTKGDAPQADVMRFLKFLKKERGFNVNGKSVLDLGSGTGRNANFLAGEGASVTGIEVSKTAFDMARARASALGVNVRYILGDIGEVYDVADNSVDLILDVTSSNSLDEKGRDIYLNECQRVLKEGGYIFVRALCKDGDKNAKNLLKQSPGPERDTYMMPDLGLIERVFTREDFVSMYGKYFKILKLEKKEGYATVAGRLYKRSYWIAYLVK